MISQQLPCVSCVTLNLIYAKLLSRIAKIMANNKPRDHRNDITSMVKFIAIIGNDRSFCF